MRSMLSFTPTVIATSIRRCGKFVYDATVVLMISVFGTDTTVVRPDLEQVADHEWAVPVDEQTGDQVRERVARCEADREAGDSERGDQ